METKHTPGPWEAQEIAPEDPQWGACEIWPANGDRPVAPMVCGVDNARLIAAAPELLEACQTFAEWLRREDAGFPAETRFNTPDGEAKWREWYAENLRVCALAQDQARAAIAKATGEPA